MSIGFGQDIITTLSYYVIGDPFSALSVFCPAKYAEYLYSAFIILRIYLAGIAFSLFTRSHGYRSLLTLCGTMIYVFSSYTLLTATLHPYFTNPLICLPLLLGADRIFEKKGSGLYIVMIALSAITNFYFFYMLCLITFLYVVFRFFYAFGKPSPGVLMRYFIRFSAFSLLGIGIAMILLLPAAVNILGSGRIEAEVIVPPFYGGEYYINLPGAFLSGTAGYYSHLGYTGVGFLSVLILFTNLRKHKHECRFFAIAFLLLTVFLLIPFFGHLFNGMSYVTNRWVWAYDFTVSHITAMALPEMVRLSKKNLLMISAAAFFYAAVLFFTGGPPKAQYQAAAACMFLLVIVLLLLHIMAETVPALPLLLSVTILSLIVDSTYIHQIDDSAYVLSFTDSGEALNDLLNDSPGYLVSRIKDCGLFRYDSGGFTTGNVKRNSSMLLDCNSCSYYYSTANPYVADFFRSISLNTPMEQTYNDLNSRLILDSLLGVKYFVVENGREAYLPYGYSEIARQTDERTVYENKDVLPIVFTASDYIPEEEYEALTALEKQQVLSQTIVLKEGQHLKKSEYTLTPTDIDYQLLASEHVTIQNNRFLVEQENAAVTLLFKAQKNTEYYVVLEGLDFEEMNPKTDFFWTAADSVNLTVSANGAPVYLKYLTPESPYYNGVHSFICNAGMMAEGEQRITVSFQKAGTYSFDSFALNAQPVDRISSSMGVFREDDTGSFREITNGIAGTLTLDSPKMLCVSVPYSENWTVYVDGVRKELTLVDQFMPGVALEPGRHDVQFLYHNRSLSIGCMVSIISIIAFILLEFVRMLKRKNERRTS